MLKDIKKIQVRVENKLRDYPNTRSNDKLLTLMIWEDKGLVLDQAQRELFLSRQIPKLESVTRARRKLQEEGKYKANAPTEQGRFFEEGEVRKHFRYH